MELLFLHEKIGRMQEFESPIDLTRLNIYLNMVVDDNPTIPYSERKSEAIRAFFELGDYAATVVQAQIAMEVLLDTVLMLMLWEEDADPKTVASTIFTEGLQKRVRTNFPARLGGDWNTKGTGEIGRWASELARLRNRVVHAAYRPQRDEAEKTLEIASGVEGFVNGRLAERRNTYMRTAIMVLGIEGLERRGLWTGQIKKFAEDQDEPSWVRSFNDWRTVLDDHQS